MMTDIRIINYGTTPQINIITTRTIVRGNRIYLEIDKKNTWFLGQVFLLTIQLWFTPFDYHSLNSHESIWPSKERSSPKLVQNLVL